MLPQINLPSSSQESITDEINGLVGNDRTFPRLGMDTSGSSGSQNPNNGMDRFPSLSNGSSHSGGINGGIKPPQLTNSENKKSAKPIVPDICVEGDLQLSIPENPFIQIQEPDGGVERDNKTVPSSGVTSPSKQPRSREENTWRPYSSDSSEELKRLAAANSDVSVDEALRAAVVDSRHNKPSPTRGLKKHRRRASGGSHSRNCSSSGGSPHTVSPSPSRCSSDSDDQQATSPQKRKRTRRPRSRNPSPVSGLLGSGGSDRGTPKRPAKGDGDRPLVRVGPLKTHESEVYWDSNSNKGLAPLEPTRTRDGASPTPSPKRGSGEIPVFVKTEPMKQRESWESKKVPRSGDRVSPTQFEDAPSPTPETVVKPTYPELHIEELTGNPEV